MTSHVMLIGLGPGEIIVILVVAFVLLIILGPKNLPKLGNSIGKGIKGLRKGMQSDEEKKDDEEEIIVETEEVEEKPKKKTTTKKTTTAKKPAAKKSTTKKKVVRKKSE